jgi:DNA-binding sugar fermentation-stimulating protein
VRFVRNSTCVPLLLVPRARQDRRLIPELLPYESEVLTEVKYGQGMKSRVDFVLRRPGGRLLHVEVKSVTLVEELPQAGHLASRILRMAPK